MFRSELPVSAARATRRRSSLCDIRDWEDPQFQDLAGRIMTGDPHTIFRHRKLWEFVRAVQAFEAGGVWHDDALGLSVAAGHERLLYFASNAVRRMVASDVYGIGDFASVEAMEGFLQNPTQYAPYAYRTDRLVPLWMNALALEFSEGIFDFALCLSSVEHFGGLNSAKRAIEEMSRVVRTGGIVFVTTDCSLNGYTTNEVFSPDQIKDLCKIPSLELIEPLDFSLSSESTNELLDMRRDKLDVQPHINLRNFAAVFTSVSLAFRKVETSKAEPESLAQNRLDILDRECASLSASTHERSRRFALERRPGLGSLLETFYHKARAVSWRISERKLLMSGSLSRAKHQSI